MNSRRLFPRLLSRRIFSLAAVALLAHRRQAIAQPAPVTLINAAYDPTRELFVEFNAAFAKYWKTRTGQDVTIHQYHGRSGQQARAVIDGLEADVVTLGMAGDTDTLVKNGGWLSANWQKKLPRNASPYTSTIVLVVRKGNPKGIKDWDDLIKPGVSVITPNPKSGTVARWSYLAAWEFAKRKFGSDAAAEEFVSKLYGNVSTMDSGSRDSTASFVRRRQGDVLIAWENSAYLLEKEFGAKLAIVAPSLSILVEPAVAVVDKVVDKKGTRAVATSYLQYLYSEEGQNIAGKNFFRPAVWEKAKAKYTGQFAKINLFTIDQAFGGWAKADKEHFADGGSFDRIYHKK